MSIDIDRFEEGSTADLRAGGRTNADTLLSFLAELPDKAFTPKEIHEATDVPRGSVGVVLSRLEDRGLVRHRGDYWAIADTERIVRFLDERDDRAWKASTIADRLDIETDSASAILSRLKHRGLVRHKRPYWAITDDNERLQSAYQHHQYHETATEQYGDEDLEALQTDEMERVQ